MNQTTTSERDPRTVLSEALTFFGREGVGLDVQERTDSSVKLAGHGGFVLISAIPKARGSEVRIVNQHWDEQAKQFMHRI